jgi:malonyl-ACP decarboxylase
MPSSPPDRGSPVVTGIGVATAFGYGKQSFCDGLFSPRNVFGVLSRPGRQCPEPAAPFIGTELPEPPQILSARVARTTGLTGQVAIAVLDEAWREAGLDAIDPERIGLVVGGSNLQSREHLLMQQVFASRLPYMLPRHGYGFFDTDLCGLCASSFAIRGFAYTVGGASASGALAVLQAADAVRSGRVDVCIALGALQDVSYYELQGLRATGAMGSTRFEPEQACRPFDRDRDGFIFGESCAALVIRRSDAGPDVRSYGSIAGGAHVANGNRSTDPSLAGEVRAIRMALADAGLSAADIDYVNAHGTGTALGDDTEMAAYREVGLVNAGINSTKSIIGHGLCAAGTVELAAVLLQMCEGRLHASRNLDNPIDSALRFITGAPEPHAIRNALKLSFGFGGIDTAIVVRAPDSN